MPELTYEVMVDWDMTDWAADPDFSEGIDDITSYVMSISFSKGKDKELGNIPASTVEIKLNNSDARFSPPNASSPLYDKLLPWRMIRVRVEHDSVWYNHFFGFISRYKIEPHPEKEIAYIYATDGMDLLARQIITQDDDDLTSMTDGAAVGKVLDAAGWSASRRDIDTDGGNITEYPACYVF